MLDARGRDIGEPKCFVIHQEPTPEKVRQVRANINRVLESIYTQRNGYPTWVKINFGEKPPRQGNPREGMPVKKKGA